MQKVTKKGRNQGCHVEEHIAMKLLTPPFSCLSWGDFAIPWVLLF